MKRITLALVATIISSTLYAQVLFSENANFTTTTNTIVVVRGGHADIDSGSFHHNGWLEVDSTFIIGNNANVSGNGVYEVGLHWENNGKFDHMLSTVTLEGDTKLITGTTETKFNNLTLSGTGRKELTINSSCAGVLTLHDRELYTSIDTFTVDTGNQTNIVYSTIFNDEGFISNTGNGRFAVLNGSLQTVNIPLGSDSSTYRFRPIGIEPMSTNAKYFAGFRNYDPSLDGYHFTSSDSAICGENREYHHLLEGSNNCNLTVSYLPSDGYYTTIADWEQPASRWLALQANVEAGNPFNEIEVLDFSRLSDAPIVLNGSTPSEPFIVGDTIDCYPALELEYYSSVDSLATIQWNLNGNGTIESSTDSSVIVNWGGSGYLTASQVTSSGCASSTSDTINFALYPSPIAGFNLQPTNIFVNTAFNAIDTSFGSISWLWDAGNFITSSDQNPIFVYNTTGAYTLQQIVYNQYGCTDTASIAIAVTNNLVLPNVISPNGDGNNDILSIGNFAEPYTISVFNRWGVKLYEQTNSSPKWNGTSPTGKDVPEGTYYYIFESGDMMMKSHLTVVR